MDGTAAQQVLGELLPERLERLRRLTGVPVALGGVTRQGAGGVRLTLDRVVGTVGDSLRGLVVRPGTGLGGCVWCRRTPLRVADYITAVTITHEYDQAVRAERLTSVFAVPVLVWGDVRCVLYGAVRERRPIDSGAVRSAVVVADQLRCDVENRLAGRPARAAATPALAPREIDVLRLVDVGASNLEIAARLGLGRETVKSYLRSAMRKLGVRNRTAAAHRARLDGVL